MNAVGNAGGARAHAEMPAADLIRLPSERTVASWKLGRPQLADQAFMNRICKDGAWCKHGKVVRPAKETVHVKTAVARKLLCLRGHKTHSRPRLAWDADQDLCTVHLVGVGPSYGNRSKQLLVSRKVKPTATCPKAYRRVCSICSHDACLSAS